ncbi:MAG: tRNA pseudouridine(38-40) synthase TruA [Bacteroidetes bacterium]|nr:MAG: tRNA pseudouridine(38-40) synthase TruA [Bacteroidota bacterium]
MTRYFLKLSYKGTNYHGWQIQDNTDTVQQEVNQALTTLFNEEILCTGCGRTDTGVHAKEFYAHFDSSLLIDNREQLIFRLNGCLPSDISVSDVFEVPLESNARFDAISRTYEYIISLKKDPFLKEQSHYLFRTLDLGLMKKAGKELKAHEDFTSFSKSNTQTKTNLCDIKKAEWTANDQQLKFTITANRFLRGMVRAIVGTLLEVGQGKITVSDFAEIIEAKDRGKAGTSVPAAGLHLIAVEYPKDLFISQTKSKL